MKCEKIRRLLQEYATRELGPEPRRYVDEHLAGCADCRQELALLTLVVSGLDRQPVLEPRPDFSARVMAGLPRQQRSLHPAWALVLLPVLGGLAWLFRAELSGPVLGLLGRLAAWLPGFATGPANLARLLASEPLLVSAFAVTLGVAGTAAAVWYCWASYCSE